VLLVAFPQRSSPELPLEYTRLIDSMRIYILISKSFSILQSHLAMRIR
jgi:hypothetical protein